MTRKGLVGLMLVSTLALAACDDREVIFQGKRESLFSPDPEVVGEAAAARFAEAEAADATNKSVPIALPAPSTLGSWTHINANAQHNVPHLALSAQPQVMFEVNIGAGNGRKHKITAEPVIADGRVFTMDSESGVVAHSTGGAALWSADLTPSSDRQGEASGGGLAYGGGILFATTGFGELIAINPASGQIAWRQDLGSPGSGAPVVDGGTVYALSTKNVAFAVSASNGRVQWQLPGTPSRPGQLGSGSPAISGGNVIVPFSIGTIVAVNRQTGDPSWAKPVEGVRTGKAYAAISEIAGAPVVSGSTVYASTVAGRTIALSTTGDERWSAEEGAVEAATVAGGSIFMIGDDLELVRLNASTGERIWGVPLPGYVNSKQRRWKKIYASYGPTLAGGRLWVASQDGLMRAFSPTDGSLVGSVQLPAGAASRPVVVGGVAYLATERGTLVALR